MLRALEVKRLEIALRSRALKLVRRLPALVRVHLQAVQISKLFTLTPPLLQLL